MGSKKFWKKFLKKNFGRQMPHRNYWGVKCHSGVLGRQMPPRGIGASNATWGCWGVKCHPEFTGASKATLRLLGRQRPWASKGPKASRRQKSGASKGPLWVKAMKATRRQSSGSQNSGVRVHVVKGPGRQRRWIRWLHIRISRSFLPIFMAAH